MLHLKCEVEFYYAESLEQCQNQIIMSPEHLIRQRIVNNAEVCPLGDLDEHTIAAALIEAFWSFLPVRTSASPPRWPMRVARDGDLAGNRFDRLPSHGIGMSNVQLGWLLDHNQTFMQRNMVEQSAGGFIRLRRSGDPDAADN